MGAGEEIMQNGAQSTNIDTERNKAYGTRTTNCTEAYEEPFQCLEANATKLPQTGLRLIVPQRWKERSRLMPHRHLLKKETSMIVWNNIIIIFRVSNQISDTTYNQTHVSREWKEL